MPCNRGLDEEHEKAGKVCLMSVILDVFLDDTQVVQELRMGDAQFRRNPIHTRHEGGIFSEEKACVCSSIVLAAGNVGKISVIVTSFEAIFAPGVLGRSARLIIGLERTMGGYNHSPFSYSCFATDCISGVRLSANQDIDRMWGDLDEVDR